MQLLLSKLELTLLRLLQGLLLDCTLLLNISVLSGLTGSLGGISLS